MFAIDQLTTLVAAVDEGTFDAAAARLRVTPSAVSQRMRALEGAAGQLLLQRTTPIRPTEAGSRLLAVARQMLLLEGEARRAVAADAEDAGMTVPIAVNADSLTTWFLRAIRPAVASGSLVFDLRREDQDHTLELLRTGQVVGAVSSQSRTVQGARMVPLGMLRYRAVATPELLDRLGVGTAGREVGLGDLADAPVVIYDRKDGLQDEFFLARVGAPMTGARHFVPNSTDYAQAVSLGFGWGLLPVQQCEAQLARGELVDLVPDHPRDMALYWHTWSLASEVLDRLTSTIVAGARTSLLQIPDGV